MIGCLHADQSVVAGAEAGEAGMVMASQGAVLVGFRARGEMSGAEFAQPVSQCCV